MRIAIAGGTGTVGTHVVAVARERGHEPVTLSRATGVDLVSGRGLARALAGADAVIDVASTPAQAARASVRFFGTVTATLLAAERRAGVPHHLALGIVGSALAPHGYYAGKAEQERLVEGGDVPWTILRATQFHEFADQLRARFSRGPVTLVPRMVSQPVAAREVAQRLVHLAEAGPSGRVADLAGPRVERMRDLVAALESRDGAPARRIVEFPLPGGFGRAMRDGTLLPTGDVTLGALTFERWLDERA